MTSTSPLSPQDPDTQRADEMDMSGSDKQESPIEVVIEALPDIESADPHALRATVVNGKEADDSDETDDGDDGPCENDSDVDSGRHVKRVKLDAGVKPGVAAVMPKQGEAGVSKDAQSEEKAAEEEDETFELRMTWAGRGFDIRVQGSDRLYDFKAMIYSLTAVPPERQKLIGLVKGKIPGDETCFKDLAIPGSGVRKFACIGTPQEMTFKDPSEIDPKHLPDVMDDFDVSLSCEKGVLDYPYLTPLLPLRVFPPTSLRLLAIVDTEPLLKGSLPTAQCLRPGLHEFLER
ncbi:hypothetical protein QFC19_006648 [Naganishia cerealis]|uniref:Uncharacterized protein n=1 Tax=Naganishia cerealis TaxID=610337 RepID=A0ACC2VGX3_9TREE|nr:hypothetical protein QFC19_006648 [Naganishia cerealis]